jgi:hypothetical protein
MRSLPAIAAASPRASGASSRVIPESAKRPASRFRVARSDGGGERDHQSLARFLEDAVRYGFHFVVEPDHDNDEV